MNQKSIITSAFLLIMIGMVYLYQKPLSQKVLTFSLAIKKSFIHQEETISRSIKTHFQQKEQITMLQQKIKELEPQASLSVAFGAKLNHFLQEANLTLYQPKLHLVQTLGYQQMQDPNRVWLEFPGFDKNKNYGLIFHGFTAGIVRTKDDKPLALLQADKKSVFSVYIGSKKVQGLAFGNGSTLLIKYIPRYQNPSIGDEVITSGNDTIFYEGIPVGRVINIIKKDMYKIATVKPYNKTEHANFYYAVEVK